MTKPLSPLRSTRHGCLAALLLGGPLLILVACSDSLTGLQDQPTPLVVLRVHVNGDVGRWPQAYSAVQAPNLRVALVWAGTWNPDPLCMRFAVWQAKGSAAMPLTEQEHAVASQGCRDAYGFVPGWVGPSAPVDSNGNATLALYHLPPAEALVGPPAGRVGYASLVVFDDVGHNDTLDLSYPGGFGLGGPPENSGRERQGGESMFPMFNDVAFGASFINMQQDHVRVVYREGNFNSKSTFFPAMGCAAPPFGYSIARIKGTMQAAQCTFVAADAEVVQVSLVDPDHIGEVLCIGESTRYMPVPPEPELKPKAQHMVCANENELVVPDGAARCAGLTRLQLVGCLDDPDCAEPAWEAPAQLPEWWPCAKP